MIDGVQVIVCEVIVAPFAAPSVNGTETAVLLVRVTVPIVGAPGAVAAKGVKEFDDGDDGDAPPEFVAVMVKLYN